jgi:hypothetical protein
MQEVKRISGLLSEMKEGRNPERQRRKILKQETRTNHKGRI